MGRKDYSTAWIVALCFVLCGIGILIRVPTFGELDGVIPGKAVDASWRNVTGLALLALKNWLSIGPINLKLQQFFAPLWQSDVNGIRFQYASYPPGYLFIPYLLTKFGTFWPSAGFLMGLSLCAQFLSSLGLALILFQISKGRHWLETSICLIAGVFPVCFFSSSLFYFQNIWWPDILAFPVLIWLSYFNFRKQTNSILYYLLIIFGLWTDWIFWIWFGLRFVNNFAFAKIKLSLKAIISGTVAIFLLILQITITHSWTKLISRIQLRSGLEGSWIKEFQISLKIFFGNTLLREWGVCTLLLFGVLLGFYLIKACSKKEKSIYKFELNLLLITTLFHFLFTHEHYQDQTYNSLRFVLLFSVIASSSVLDIFLIFPQYKRLVFSFFILVFTCIGLEQAFAYKALAKNLINTDSKKKEICEFIRTHTVKGDIIYSPHFRLEPLEERDDIEENIRLLPICERFVHFVSKPDQVPTNKNAKVLLLWFPGNSWRKYPFLGKMEVLPAAN